MGRSIEKEVRTRAGELPETLQRLRERACAAIGVDDDGRYLADKDLHDIASSLTIYAARLPYNEAAATN